MYQETKNRDLTDFKYTIKCSDTLLKNTKTSREKYGFIQANMNDICFLYHNPFNGDSLFSLHCKYKLKILLINTTHNQKENQSIKQIFNFLQQHQCNVYLCNDEYSLYNFSNYHVFDAVFVLTYPKMKNHIYNFWRSMTNKILDRETYIINVIEATKNYDKKTYTRKTYMYNILNNIYLYQKKRGIELYSNTGTNIQAI